MASGPEQEIRRRISLRGRITFCEFMELALYWPSGGYYASQRAPGAGGDFFTGPLAHPAFGALLGVQAYLMWQEMGRPHPFWVVEAGAGNGLLCHNLVSFSCSLPGHFARALRYLCIDGTLALGLEAELPPDMRGRVARLRAHTLPLEGLAGCILCNELVDAFPVHRVVLRRGRLRELYVALDGESLVEVEGPPSTVALERRLERVGASLGEGWCGEINLRLDPWVARAAAALDRGYLLVIDYGHPAAHLYSAQRPRGTLTTFRHHVQTDDPLHHIGEQDITAQVDFTALEQASTGSGLTTVSCISQRRFLMDLGLGRWLARLAELPQAEADANRMGMQQLARPGSMGDFRVLLQAKGVSPPPPWGERRSEAEALVEGLSPPLLTRRHLPLLQGRYPQQGWGWEGLWPPGEERS